MMHWFSLHNVHAYSGKLHELYTAKICHLARSQTLYHDGLMNITILVETLF